MSEVKNLLKRINSLSYTLRKQIFIELRKEFIEPENAHNRISKYFGVAQGIWEEEPQEFVNDLRKDERN